MVVVGGGGGVVVVGRARVRRVRRAPAAAEGRGVGANDAHGGGPGRGQAAGATAAAQEGAARGGWPAAAARTVGPVREEEGWRVCESVGGDAAWPGGAHAASLSLSLWRPAPRPRPRAQSPSHRFPSRWPGKVLYQASRDARAPGVACSAGAARSHPGVAFRPSPAAFLAAARVRLSASASLPLPKSLTPGGRASAPRSSRCRWARRPPPARHSPGGRARTAAASGRPRLTRRGAGRTRRPNRRGGRLGRHDACTGGGVVREGERRRGRRAGAPRERGRGSKSARVRHGPLTPPASFHHHSPPPSPRTSLPTHPILPLSPHTRA